MAYTYPLPEEAGYNVTQGLDKYFQWILNVDSSFINLFLIFLFVVIFIGGSTIDRRLTARAEFLKWGFISSIITMGSALLISLVSATVSSITIIICISTCVVFGIFFLGSKYT